MSSFLLGRRFNHYQIAVFLSSLSLVFGLLREFLIVGLLGFSAKNDGLQIYLSIFYTIGLTIDAMRLACLNLFTLLPLSRIIFCSSLVGLPFAIGIGLMMSYSTPNMDNKILVVTILGSYFNLVAALLITYKQRQNSFLAAQIINVLPNFVLIPGILICYWLADNNIVSFIILLTSSIPVIQCILLLMIPNKHEEKVDKPSISIIASILLIMRHFSAVLGEQLLQVITRAAFFNYGTGYLSVYAMGVRIYAALRFILIDSYIGSKLSTWKKELHESDYYLLKMVNSFKLSVLILFSACVISVPQCTHLLYSAIQMTVLLIAGFYFSTLVRVVYFKINRHENNASLVMRFAGYEFIFFICAYLFTLQSTYSIMALLWIGYVVKPFTQLLLLRKKFISLQIAKEHCANEILQKIN